jgi:hypothetical protein
MPVCALLVCAILPASCGGGAGSSATSAPTVAAAATSSVATATASATASPSAQIVAFPDLPFIVGTNGGDLYFQLINGQPVGRKVHACDGSIQNLVAYGRQALFLCYPAFPSTPTLTLYDDDTGMLIAIAKTQNATYALTGTSGVVYVTIGTQSGTAPIPTTRLMLFDLRTGATTQIDDRYGVAFDVRLTGEGVMVWRPKNSLSFMRPDAEAGTWILHGTTLTRLSLYRLIEGGNGRDLLESEPVDPSTGYLSSSFCCTVVVLKTTSEQRLTPTDVPNEKGLALLDDGRLVTWGAESGEYDGSVVIYNGTRVERTDRGRFGAFRVLRSGDWLVAQEAAPTPGLHAYRISDGAFAAMPGTGFSALAILGPKK